MRRAVHSFLARRMGEDLVLETRRDDDRCMRWVFSDIGANSFVWRNLLEEDDGWRVTQDFVASRMGASSPAQTDGR